MTRIVLISDTHGLHESMPSIPDGDILIHAGDITRRGSVAELSGISEFFASLPHAYKIVIAGNHDFCFEREKERAVKQLRGVIYLQDKLTKVMGLQIYGSPWQPRFGDWAFNLDRGAPLKKVWSSIPQGIDVLVTHGPPAGILDVTDVGHHHVGCQDLLDAVTRIKPKLHVFGHIHCGHGRLEVDGTTFVNACTCDEAYQPVNSAFVIDL
jgi:Icc-related predicted phosphoesterase